MPNIKGIFTGLAISIKTPNLKGTPMFKIRSQIQLLVLISLLIIGALKAENTRTEINIPDILDYQTLKCDFHMHTLFSDGNVWPTNRVKEAWQEGLDAISITDHIEYKVYQEDVPINFNRPYEIAQPLANELDLILIHGAEITRSMPPGHLNAIFLKDAAKLDVAEPMDAIQAAAEQGAYIFWNHPGWKSQRPSGIPKWFEEHETIYQKGWLKGVELANFKEYYPKVLDWMYEKDLTIFGNSDVHNPIYQDWDYNKGEHRPITLVFARSRTKQGIREALENGRTAVYFEDKIMGRQKFLTPIWNNSVNIKNKEILVDPEGEANLQVYNSSDLVFSLELVESCDHLEAPREIFLPSHKTVLLPVEKDNDFNPLSQKVKLKYKVKNMLIKADQCLPVDFEFQLLSLNNVSIQPHKSFLGKNKEYKLSVENKPENLNLHYSIDNSQLSVDSKTIEQPFQIKNDTTVVNFAIFKDGYQYSPTRSISFVANPISEQNVELLTQPTQKYKGKGAATLFDGLVGTVHYREGKWLGYKGNSIEVLVDVKNQNSLQNVRIGVLRDNNSWIFLPSKITIEGSQDGEQFELINEKKINGNSPDSSPLIKEVKIPLTNFQHKLLKITIHNYGTLPDWHNGAGDKSWLFCDEIVID